MSRGHIRELPSGSWRVYVSAGSSDDGQRRQVTRTVKGSRRAAERELTRLLHELDAGVLAGGRQPLARYLATEWLPQVVKVSNRGRPLAPTTRQRFFRRLPGGVQGDRRRPARGRPRVHVERLRDALLADGLAPQTAASVLRVLSQALNAAVAKGYVGRNWADHALVRRPSGPTRDFVVIDARWAPRS